jgi:hypothetical protein
LLVNVVGLRLVSTADDAVPSSKLDCWLAELNVMLLAAMAAAIASVIVKSAAADTVIPVGATLVVTGN